MPMGQVRSWMRLWKNAADDLRKDIKEVWKIGLRKMAEEKTRWMRVKGPLTATIATLMDAGWAPVLPHKWLTRDKSQTASFDAIDGVTQLHVCHVVENDIIEKVWRNVAEAHCGQGLGRGGPLLDPAEKAYKKL